MKRHLALLLSFTLAGAVCLAASTDYTIRNPSMTDPIASTDWSPFTGTVTHQAIDSTADPNPGSGSMLFTFTGTSGSITQDTGLTASGQTLTGFRVDLAHDGTITDLMIGFYEANAWDVFAGGAVDAMIAPISAPADTDGTLDTFTTIDVPEFTVPSSGNPILLFIGTSATGAYGAATVGSKIAIDNVRLATPAGITDWALFD